MPMQRVSQEMLLGIVENVDSDIRTSQIVFLAESDYEDTPMRVSQLQLLANGETEGADMRLSQIVFLGTIVPGDPPPPSGFGELFSPVTGF